jgi:hypothetical protein
MSENKTTVIDWHPWPEEKPPDIGEYDVTVESQVRRGPRRDIRYYDGHSWISYHASNREVIAWAYLIEPYRRKE